MKKLLLGTLACVLIFALAGWATQTRVMTLGNTNNIVKDEANILLYPSTINAYRTMVLGEVSSMGLYSVGGHYDMGEDKCVIGLYLDQRGLGLMPYQPDPNGDGQTDNRLNLFYGRAFGDTKFGAALSLYSDSYKMDGDPSDKTELSNMVLGLRLGITSMEDKLDLAGGFQYGTWTNVNDAGNDVNEPESNMSLDFGGRYWHEYSDQVFFVPHLGFGYSMGGYKDANDNKSTTNEMMFDLGCGVNIIPEEHILLLFDLGIMYSTSTSKYEPASGTSSESKESYMNLPYYKVGLEGHVTKWWDLRLGAVKSWSGSSLDITTDITRKEGMASTSTYLGSGVHFGNLFLDVQVDPNFVLKGPNFVSGYTGYMASMASIKYMW